MCTNNQNTEEHKCSDHYPKCKFCGSTHVNKTGRQKYNNKQKYYCRDCKKVWTEGIDGRTKHGKEQKQKVV
jgi:transposase-like protein